VHVGASFCGHVALDLVKSRCEETKHASQELRQQLADCFSEEEEKVSSKHTATKVEAVRKKKDKHWKPNAMQKMTGVDTPLQIAGRLACGSMRKKVCIPCIKIELEAHSVACQADASITCLLELLRLDEQPDDVDKKMHFEPKIADTWPAAMEMELSSDD